MMVTTMIFVPYLGLDLASHGVTECTEGEVNVRNMRYNLQLQLTARPWVRDD